jgi:hypothetical protein
MDESCLPLVNARTACRVEALLTDSGILCLVGVDPCKCDYATLATAPGLIYAWFGNGEPIQ